MRWKKKCYFYIFVKKSSAIGYLLKTAIRGTTDQGSCTLILVFVFGFILLREPTYQYYYYMTLFYISRVRTYNSHFSPMSKKSQGDGDRTCWLPTHAFPRFQRSVSLYVVRRFPTSRTLPVQGSTFRKDRSASSPALRIFPKGKEQRRSCLIVHRCWHCQHQLNYSAIAFARRGATQETQRFT